LCQSASRVKLIRGLSSTSKAEDLWTTRLGTAYCQRFPFSLIVVALCAVQNSSHLVATVIPVGLRASKPDSIAARLEQLEVEVGVKHLQAGASGSCSCLPPTLPSLQAKGVNLTVERANINHPIRHRGRRESHIRAGAVTPQLRPGLGVQCVNAIVS